MLRRLIEVERRHLAGHPNRLIAAVLDVDEKTIRDDLKRLKQLWHERIKGAQEQLRAQKVAELADVKQRAIAAAEFDEMCERAVLFDDPLTPVHERPDETKELPHVHRDSDGRAQFRGQKAQALNVARQAVMDQAKILGIVVEKQEHSGPGGGPVPITEIVVRKGTHESVDG